MNTWITRVDLFKNCPEALIIQLTMAIKQQTFPPQEKILVPGDWSDKMFIVRKGCRHLPPKDRHHRTSVLRGEPLQGG